MPSEEPELLPGDRNFPADRLIVPEKPPAPPRRRYPMALLILGGVLALALLVGGFVAVRVALGDPSTRGAGPGDPMTTLKPREGTPAPLQRVEVGRRVPVEGLYGKGTFMVVRYEWSDQGDLPPTTGREYLNVEVRYDVAEGSMFINPDYFTAYDLAKNEYYVGIGSGKVPIGTQELKGGKTATGWVSIELPPEQSFFVVSDEGINALVMVDIPKP